jgi:uncharacterized membrane protein YeaQ/YmgE (transglycosylase-associated protein family)
MPITRSPAGRLILAVILIVVALATVVPPAALAQVDAKSTSEDDGIRARIGETQFSITFDELFIWLTIGALAGAFVGMVSALRGKERAFGWPLSFFVGLVGAVLGGLIVDTLGIDFGLGRVEIEYSDLVAAYGGSILLLIVVWYFTSRRRRQSR